MATLYKRPNSPFWIAQYFDASGRRVNKSTKCPHKGKNGEKPSPTAKRIAAGFEAEARKTQKGQGELQKVFSAVIESASRAAGEEKLTLEVAKAYIEKLHRAANPDFVAVSISTMFDDWLDAKSRRVSASTQKLYRDAKRHFLLGVGEKKFAAPAHMLKKHDIEKSLKILQDSGLRGSTINLSLSVWKSILRDAVKDSVITKSPAEDVEGLPVKDSKKRTTFTPSEVRAMLDVSDNEWQGLILVAAHTAIRMMDSTTLRKSNIRDGFIYMLPTKSGEVVSMAVTASLGAWIDAQPGDVLFPSLSQKKKSTISEGFKTIMRKAGVLDSITLPTGEVRSRSFHSLRHSANSWMANAGIDIATRQLVLGHASAKQNMDYTTLSPEARRAAMASLPDLMAR